MKHLISILLSLFVLFTSCQKELNNENDTNPVLPIPDSTLLSMYIEFDTTAISSADTISKRVFYYDNARRNTSIDLFYYDNGVLSIQQYKSVFFYNGSDTLPFKKIVTSPFLPPTDSRFYEVEDFYFYTDSKLTKDSTIQSPRSTPGTLVRNYVYNNLGIIRTVTGYDNDPVPFYTHADTFYVQRLNGNTTKQTDSTDYFDMRNFEFVYDSHPNPFYRTQNKISLDNSYPVYYTETTIEEIFEKNNIAEINQFDGTYYNYHYKFAYEYKPNGYPKIVRYYDQNTPANFGKGLFFYSN